MPLGRKTALERPVTFPVRISKRNVRDGRGAEMLHIPMTRGGIANYLGLMVDIVSRNFTKLKVSRTIRLYSNSEVEILGRCRLESIAEEGTALFHRSAISVQPLIDFDQHAQF